MDWATRHVLTWRLSNTMDSGFCVEALNEAPPGEDRDRAVKNRDFVAKRMTPAQISEAQKLAREWKAK